MATKSILKTIFIKDNKSALRLVNALENAQNKSSKDVSIPMAVRTLNGSDVRRLFDEKA